MGNYEYIQNLSGQKVKVSSYLKVKRFLDIIVSLILLIPSSVLILIFGILVKLETPGKMFYSQERVGIMGKPIYITKLRSMYQDAEKKSGAMWAVKNDARVTKVGSFIRKTRIDELPQLFSVLKGDLSLIGPRPERPMFTEEFSKDIPGFEQRLRVTPGLSGWAQVNGGYDATPSEKLVDDMFYIEHISPWLDFKILWMTIKVVLTGHGAR
ncbi:sugar transferase [Leuconostoc lactis]|uniref:sugar transferase n=1 Tax=Leuconostoc lactis TaxID=1246 RepID=UPI000B05663F